MTIKERWKAFEYWVSNIWDEHIFPIYLDAFKEYLKERYKPSYAYQLVRHVKKLYELRLLHLWWWDVKKELERKGINPQRYITAHQRFYKFLWEYFNEKVEV